MNNSAKIIKTVDSSNNQDSQNSDSSILKNKVYSLEVTLKPASGHAWTDGTSQSKTITVYGVYSGVSNKSDK
ncbi:hypothetical protein [Malacoplasma penetrans]|uniref:hypothetical protein n=1 Tax=Malacoplasma penetrans TaxID=28227 RepID=UPI001E4EAA98|nr:hypothetical protein [Malacoplasma penetrans]